MQTFLVIAIVDGAQLIRLLLGWSPEDAERRARYLWRDNAITSLEVNAPLDVTVPDEWEAT
jgi:hypothetical protein